MIAPYDPDHLETSIRRFRAFFSELHETFVERGSVLTQCGLALLSRQHVLLTGPPGTAKSQLAALVLGRIIDESTGAPSLFSRQFTENTVQTDLIGSIDFKTLMESGRTEHFTDEGMLGSVHAFLDEVLDGRDMLLRSTLNILHERELKQGGTIAKGRIECAFMTSNRYIAEVLDSARETLLAFIDRISFISFIPRGFSSVDSMRTVVRRHGGRFGRHRPSAYLSVQDLDVLQAAVDLTYVPEEICDAVTELVASLDAELAEARRADPKFQPTRYLSTRSAVLATDVLRAVVVYDKIFNRPDRSLQVAHDDLGWLRYFLLLNGVPREAIAACIERETDPRERRQLDIMATEAELFELCLRKLPRVAARPEPRRLELRDLQAMTMKARTSGDPDALAKAVDALITATESGATDAGQAVRMLVDTVGTLSSQALRAGLAPSLEGEEPLTVVTRQLGEIADELERGAGLGRPLAQWLRGRLLGLLDDALRLSVVPTAATVELLASSPSIEAIAAQVTGRLDDLGRLGALRRRLQTSGATMPPTEEGDPWNEALAKLEDELVLLWDARFRLAAVALLGRSAQVPLSQVLHELSPLLEDLHADARRLGDLGRPCELVRRVTGHRIEPLVARAFERLDGRDRAGVIEQVEAVVAELRTAGLDDVISADRFVAWTVPALVRDEPRVSEERPAVLNRRDYDQVRAREAPVCITDTLVRVATGTLSVTGLPVDDPPRAAEAVWQVLRSLDEPWREQVVQLDLARIRRGIEALEAWWVGLGEAAKAAEDEAGTVALLEAAVRSGYLRAIRGDGEPLRLAAEVGHLVEAFPSCVPQGSRLRARIEELDATSTRVMVARLEDRSNRAWSEALAGST
ncbi:AAA family ATPase [Paraliomyxa miuraensis]|uniref:AAA family ATPase n=1 Tax=Paraliomyxa miuraensis TaxID=376150 RepID=UPI002257DDF2|nr:AAA family ATPase [Paraliomyxa miuraensis]MCX4241769.1 AAA family ATPase [Paraliomyxa miuraensis]